MPIFVTLISYYIYIYIYLLNYIKTQKNYFQIMWRTNKTAILRSFLYNSRVDIHDFKTTNDIQDLGLKLYARSFYLSRVINVKILGIDKIEGYIFNTDFKYRQISSIGKWLNIGSIYFGSFPDTQKIIVQFYVVCTFSRESLVHQLCLFHLFLFPCAGKGANGILIEYILHKQRYMHSMIACFK